MASPSSTSPQLGMVFDQRYRVLRKLEAGGMGTVYEAEQIRLGKRVAIKVLRREVTENETALRRFEREARLASRIRHRNVVELLDFGVENDTAYYVMELLEGRNLSSVLHEHGALPWRRARSILLQIARALGAAHRLGIIHRDVKPANCFLLDPEDEDEGELVKVLDFGIAKLDDTFDADGQLTKTTELLGTVAYMSPEQAQSQTIDARSDVYSLGVLVYQVLTGRLPFNDDSAFNVLLKHVREPPKPPRRIVPAIPEAVEEAILRALAKKPEDRFETMDALKAALAEVPATALGNRAPTFERPEQTGSRTIPVLRKEPRADPSASTVVLAEPNAPLDVIPRPDDFDANRETELAEADEVGTAPTPADGTGHIASAEAAAVETEIATAPTIDITATPNDDDDLLPRPASSTIPVLSQPGGTVLAPQPGMAAVEPGTTAPGTHNVPGASGNTVPGAHPPSGGTVPGAQSGSINAPMVSGAMPAIASGSMPATREQTLPYRQMAGSVSTAEARARERRLVKLGLIGGVIALVLGAAIGAWMTQTGPDSTPTNATAPAPEQAASTPLDTAAPTPLDAAPTPLDTAAPTPDTASTPPETASPDAAVGEPSIDDSRPVVEDTDALAMADPSAEELETPEDAAGSSASGRRSGKRRKETDASVKAKLARKAKKACSGVGGSGTSVRVSLSIDPAGALTLARTEAPHQSSALGKCVRGAMNGARFPATGDRRVLSLTVDI